VFVLVGFGSEMVSEKCGKGCICGLCQVKLKKDNQTKKPAGKGGILVWMQGL